MSDRKTILAIGAHPDDIELSCSGTLISMVNKGWRGIIADMTEGEMGTRGTPEQRRVEAAKSAEIMGLDDRQIFTLRDGWISDTEEAKLLLVKIIRHYRPDIILSNPEHERHPDHENLGRLVRQATFLSGLRKIETEWEGNVQEPHRPRQTFCYMQTYEFKPDFYFDISEAWEKKMESIHAFETQFFIAGRNSPEPQTFISRPEFLEMIESRARYFGEKIGVRYAEAFYSATPLGIQDLSSLIR